ncbi:competence protein CoiA family protein [Roseomonas chloroacetimidivorans]|uniref:competence protein CoiA family protein n=1 Tax=Roseomonas chloroacetimidivorans TaxID=1766656 RepID=UPI003C7624CD
MSAPGISLPYGLAPNGRLVAVADVPRGKQIDVVCPQCKAILVARKGEVLRHHFAHANDASCAGSYETMLHLLGKQVIRDACSVRLPAVVAEYNYRRREVAAARSFEADGAAVEVPIGPYKADVVLTKGRQRLVVEILVTHRTTPEKVEAFRAMGQDAIEINISDLIGAEDLSNAGAFILREAPRTWLQSNARDEAVAELKVIDEREQANLERLRRQHRLRQERDRQEALKFLAEKAEAERQARLREEQARRPVQYQWPVPDLTAARNYMPGDPDPLRDGLLRGFHAHYRPPPPRSDGKSIYEETWP